MKAIYVAGPFSAATPWLIENNVRRAEELALKVCALGEIVALCPHSMYRFFHGMETSEYWYEATMELLRRCDGIILLNNWESSKGAVEEYKEAESLGLKIFHEFELEAVRRWAQNVHIGSDHE